MPQEPSSAEEVIKERQSTHGEFHECAEVSQDIMRALRKGRRFKDLSDAQVEALQMVAHKMHRIVCGNPDHDDHWLDGAGYFTLGLQDVLRRNPKEDKGPFRPAKAP